MIDDKQHDDDCNRHTHSGLTGAGMKKKEALENPIVDLVIITIGVFAFAAIFRVIGAQLGSPGMASFFGGDVDAASTQMGR